MAQRLWVLLETTQPPDLLKLLGSDLERGKTVSHSRLVDGYSRKISHLRLSLIDQCNFRCLYCMPPEGIETMPKQSYLQVSEIKRLVQILSHLGINKIRLTGGEPLLRNDILKIVDKISKIQGIQDLALTTNGSLLKKLAKPLKDFGLNRINISLDSLNPKTFHRMSLRDDFFEVMDGILEALHVGFPVKINVVVMKGYNEHEIPDFIKFALNNPIEEVRFIEFMPLCGTGWKPQHVYSMEPWIQKVISDYDGQVLDQSKDSVAKSFKVNKNSKNGRVGFITTMSQPFCGQCSRIRITADGILRPCLFSNQGTSLKELLQNEASDDVIIKTIQETVFKKSKGNEFAKPVGHDQSLGSYLSQKINQPRQTPMIRSIGG